MYDDGPFEVNVWTGFADLMLALVLVLALLLFLMTLSISLGTVNLKQVENNQRVMIDSIARRFQVSPQILSDGDYGISSTNNGVYDIRVSDDLNSQRITFSDKLLFRPDDIQINDSGRVVLATVGETLKAQLPLVKEIQIQGHADTQKSGRYSTNIQLAAMRAISVFQFLQDSVGIDPSSNLMSATTFGEFKSVQRDVNSSNYNLNQLLQDNGTEPLRSLNRRIEITLIYKR